MSPSSGSDQRRRRRSLQLRIGWVALLVFVTAVVLALLKFVAAGQACVVVGGVLAFAALGIELRQRNAVRRAVARGDEEVFSEGGTFGTRRSSSTHTRMM